MTAYLGAIPPPDGKAGAPTERVQAAIEARQAGEFERAATLFAAAADDTEDLQTHLNLQIRQACCLLAIERYDDAAELAQVVAQRARAEQFLPELADALCVIVDHHTQEDRLAEAAHLLSEAMHVLDRLPNEPANYQVMHNMGATYARCGFVEAALELYEVDPLGLDRLDRAVLDALCRHFGGGPVGLTTLALAVAEQNMCLLLTRWSIAANGIQAGRLKQVSHSMVLHESAYHLVWPDRSNQSHALVLFQNWLIEQCKMFEQFTQLRLKQLDER